MSAPAPASSLNPIVGSRFRICDAPRVGDQHPIVDDHEPLIPPRGQRIEGAIEIARPPCGHVLKLDLHRPSSTIKPSAHEPMDRIAGIQEDADTRSLGQDFSEQLQAFGTELGQEERRAGDVPPGPREALDQAGGYCVAGHDHDDGNRRGGPFGRLRPRGPMGEDDVDLEPDQLSREIGESIVSPLCPSVLDGDVLPFDPAEGAKPLPECLQLARVPGGGGGPQEPDPGNLDRLLRDGKRRGEEASGQDDREDPPQSSHAASNSTSNWLISIARGRPPESATSGNRETVRSSFAGLLQAADGARAVGRSPLLERDQACARSTGWDELHDDAAHPSNPVRRRAARTADAFLQALSSHTPSKP
jgi:hypothetical protein